MEVELRAALIRDSQRHKTGLRWLIRDATPCEQDKRAVAQQSRQVAALNTIVAVVSRSLKAVEVAEALQQPLRTAVCRVYATAPRSPVDR